MARTGMIARGLRGVRRMARGADSTVYVLVKTTGADSLTSVGSTEAANIVIGDGSVTLTLCEDATLDETAMARAAAFALSSPADGTFKVWRRTEVNQAVGSADRSWSFTIAPTGVVFSVSGAFTYTFPFQLA
jgi:hypothetical protein